MNTLLDRIEARPPTAGSPPTAPRRPTGSALRRTYRARVLRGRVSQALLPLVKTTGWDHPGRYGAPALSLLTIREVGKSLPQKGAGAVRKGR
jgi:hypothetical protein